MIRTAAVASVALALCMGSLPVYAAAAKTADVCGNAALSTADQTECKDKLAAAKTAKAKAKVRADYQAKVKAATKK